MARVSKEDLIKRYHGRIQFAKKWRQQECIDETWKRLVDMYRLKMFPKGMTSEDQVAVAIAFGTINVISPSVSINYPKITVAARKPGEDAQAVITETVINYWWRHYEIKPEFRRAVKDFLVIGHGWLKVGYRFREKELNLGEEEIFEEFEAQKAEADAYAEENPDEAAGLPTDDDIFAGTPTTKTVTVEDRPFVERVSPFNVFVDPEATSLADAKWIAQRIERTLEEVRKDDRYPRSVRMRLKADASVNKEWLPTDKDALKRLGDDVKRVVVWEYYDLSSETMCVFADGNDEFLISPQNMPYEFGHPFVMLRNYDVPDQFYPIGDLEAIEPLQHELNAVRSDMANHRKRYARKYLYNPSSFDEQGRAALESPEDGTYVPVADESRPLADHVIALPNTPLDPQMYQYSDTIASDVDVVTGVSEYARGGLPEIRRTATEASIIQDASNARAADKLAIIEDGVAAVARRLVQLAQQFMTGDQVARITGKQGQPLWVEFEADDIKGEFDFEVEAGSTQPQNDTARRQTATTMLQTLAPFMETGLVNAQELLKYVLQFGFGIRNPERFMGQPMPPTMDPNAAPTGEKVPGETSGPALPPGVPVAAPELGAAPAGPPDLSGIDPAILAQLAAQVGLTLPNQGA